MCGIAGFLDPAGIFRSREPHLVIRAMTDAIAHRGPDADGHFIDATERVGLGHRRLSILDLSAAGAQPMWSADQRFCMVFNGEIYNFEELRERFEGDAREWAWRGHADTEVLVECIARWGLVPTLERSNGMFALALWDVERQALTLARDRLGEKPVYYGWQNSVLLFGSELKSLMSHPSCDRRLSESALALYLTFSYVPTPLSIFAGIHKLEAAHFITYEMAAGTNSRPTARAYWQLPRPQPTAMPESQALEEMQALLSDAVRLRMRADVPMGAFLSGGIDSSLIVALMQAQASSPVRTFSIGFGESAFNEAPFAKLVAQHLGTSHTELVVSAEDALNVVPKLPRIYDEPFADSSQIPTYLLAALTRAHVTVSLSGDGGDEIFGGYARYFSFRSAWQKLGRLPRRVRRSAAAMIGAMPPGLWRALARVPAPLLRSITPNRMERLAEAVQSSDAHEFYRTLVTFWKPEGLLRQMPPLPTIPFERHHIERDFLDPMLGMAYLDTMTYLPEDILVKVDRATMAASLEGRIPLLDHRVVELAARLPADVKVRGSTGKWLLLQLLDRYVPRNLIDRPKQGFGIPIGEWLRGPLRHWADDLLNDRKSVLAQTMNYDAVLSAWRNHRDARDNQAYRLWIVLMLQAWAAEWHPTL